MGHFLFFRTIHFTRWEDIYWNAAICLRGSCNIYSGIIFSKWDTVYTVVSRAHVGDVRTQNPRSIEQIKKALRCCQGVSPRWLLVPNCRPGHSIWIAQAAKAPFEASVRGKVCTVQFNYRQLIIHEKRWSAYRESCECWGMSWARETTHYPEFVFQRVDKFGAYSRITSSESGANTGACTLVNKFRSVQLK